MRSRRSALTCISSGSSSGVRASELFRCSTLRFVSERKRDHENKRGSMGGGRLGNAGSKLKGGGEQEEGYLWSKRDYVPLYWKDVTGRLVGTLH